ncbi:MAG: hypothetical protein IMZ50_05305 [Candidatus Atribacteria bacterium]|nr:hypothetical protein [Candidatus Atribacteria bacterium]
MATTFRFLTRLNLVELLGRRAKNIPELLEGLRLVPGTSIYYHTHRFLQQHHYLSPEPPNDFAFWVTNSLGLDSLGERLASVDTVSFPTIRDLRTKYLEILEFYSQGHNARNGDCPEGQEFHFMSFRTFILPTPYEAHNLKEFRDILQKVSINSIYFHIFDARLRLKKGKNDFSNWLEEMGETQLAREISRLDPYTITFEGLRRDLIQRVSRHVKNS